MLKELYCDKFISGEKIREKIIFHQGLNIIEGNDHGDNSIGKSTFLMCIDFAFGGKDYVEKLKDVQKHVGPHTICFAFLFDQMYYFCRSTDEKNVVYLCNEKYEKTETKWDVAKDYLPFLKQHYEISLKHLSFRQIVSRFSRIYNRENRNELSPLRSHDNETEKESLEELIKLFELFDPIEELSKQEKEFKDKKETFGKAQDYKFLPKINEAEFKENQRTIERLTKEKEELAEKSDKGLLELDSEKAERVSQIKCELSGLRRKRSLLYRQLDYYKQDSEYEPTSYQKDFSDLLAFFPNANIKSIEEIEEFHKKLSIILKTELKSAINELWLQIRLLSSAITAYEEELETVQKAKNVSKVVLNAYASIDKQLDALKKINEYHIQKKEIDQKVKQITKELEAKKMIQLTSILTDLNSKMKEINSSFYDEGTNPPLLVIPKSNDYVFDTPDDQGTGTKYKGMIILDTAIMSLTCLPFIIHDSIMFSNMSIARVEKTFELYNQMNKQVFIAIDRTAQYNDDIAKLIENHRILYLSPNGNELFGKAWNKNETEAK